jgi:hypothetical protein
MSNGQALSDEDLARLKMRLVHINKRIDWLASAEARAALVGGAAADGRFWSEKNRLLDEAERILDQLEKGWRPDA